MTKGQQLFGHLCVCDADRQTVVVYLSADVLSLHCVHGKQWESCKCCGLCLSARHRATPWRRILFSCSVDVTQKQVRAEMCWELMQSGEFLFLVRKHLSDGKIDLFFLKGRETVNSWAVVFAVLRLSGRKLRTGRPWGGENMCFLDVCLRTHEQKRLIRINRWQKKKKKKDHSWGQG